jgi:hypothetical protein
MKRVSEILRRFVLLLCVVGLGSCGYTSSPGIVVETKQYPLRDKTTLIVTRHLDDWRTGSLFTFEWYVVKCKSSSGPEAILLQEMVSRGLFSNEIPKERIQIADGEIGYAYFKGIVVFDKSCNQLSYFYPWRTDVIDTSRIAAGYSIDSANVEQTGRGYAHLSWALREGGARELMFLTNDFGVHWNNMGSASQ